MRNSFGNPNRGDERTVAFIVARLSSSRLAAKQLRAIGDRTLLDWILDGLSKSRQIDAIVLATVAEAANEPLRELARQKGVACFWFEGQVDHVTTRLRRAAEVFGADVCVLISGDCPLVCAPAIDQMIAELKKTPEADVVRIVTDDGNYRPALEGVSVARRRAWQRADDLADRPELKEHQFPVIGLQPERFRAVDLSLSAAIYMSPHRLSVDTWADLEFMNQVHATLAQRGKRFELPEVVRLLEERSDLKKINRHVHQRPLVEDVKRVLFIVDAGKQYGYGHLMRSLELALQIVESLGWPASFVVDDEQAESLVEEHGLRAIRGAFARPEKNRPPRAGSFNLEALLPDYDLLVLDIFDQRGPAPGWRAKLNSRIPTMVVENLQPWAYEADLIVLPNILAPPQVTVDNPASDLQGEPYHAPSARIVGGPQYIILRRSIRQAQNGHDKDIDLLVYLHDEVLRNDIAVFAAKHRWKTEILDGFNPRFPDLLARSKLFLSGFGVSFNEALALQTLPICWPDSEAHRRDAVSFYGALNMPPYVVDSTAELADVVLPLLQSDVCCCAAVEDGTAGIVEELTRLVKVV
ncbi:MAG: NTP transferase domain-containing protein [Desulfobacterales bacterium]|nr:MAG: NTP transferase domain-containing protein [Desulfobacterales bacterium]